LSDQPQQPLPEYKYALKQQKAAASLRSVVSRSLSRSMAFGAGLTGTASGVGWGLVFAGEVVDLDAALLVASGSLPVGPVISDLR
jgi:hypothetical protein